MPASGRRSPGCKLRLSTASYAGSSAKGEEEFHEETSVVSGWDWLGGSFGAVCELAPHAFDNAGPDWIGFEQHARREELLQLPGSNDDMAERILDNRPYRSKFDLLNRLIVPKRLLSGCVRRFTYDRLLLANRYRSRWRRLSGLSAGGDSD